MRLGRRPAYRLRLSLLRHSQRPRKQLLLLSLLALLLLSAFAAWGQSAAGMTRVNYEGTLGPSKVNMTLEVQRMDVPGKAIIHGGHYFYTRYYQDIPLTGSIEGQQITLHETQGGTFTLHFKGNGSQGKEPLHFHNSVGMEGTWKNGATTLPVSFSSGFISAVPENGRWYGQVTDQSDAAFEAKVQGFYKAALAGDRSAAARYVAFPLRVNHDGKSRMIRSAAQLSAQWDSIVTSALIAAMKQEAPHDLAVAKGEAMLGSGLVWFSDKGADAINLP